MFLCKHDAPPNWAMAMASFDSETVSIAADRIGTSSFILFDKLVVVLHPLG